MYQFTTTTIINSNVDTSGATKIVATSDSFSVLRTGTYKSASVVGAHKRPGSAGVLEVAKFTVPAGTLGDVYRLGVEIRLEGSIESDYASPFYFFNKVNTFEVLHTGTDTTTATAIKTSLDKVKDKYGYSYFNVSVSGAEVTLTAKTPYQRFKSVVLSKSYDTGTNTMIEPVYTTVATATVTTPGKVAFGDYTWLISNISIQTLDKGRLFATLTDEKPIVGATYTQYTLKYSIEKDIEIGIASGLKSITEHVFYVKSDIVAAFEAALTTAGISFGLGLTVADDTLANSATTQATVTNAIGGITYSIKSGTSATVAATGLVTADATIDGATVVKVTDAVGNTAEVTVTVS